MSVIYTDATRVDGIVYDLRAPHARSASGYGDRIPTPYRVRYIGRWRRVYAICYGNASSVYVNVAGARQFLDIDTEYALSDGLSHPGINQSTDN